MKIPDGWKKVHLEKVAKIQTGIAKNSKAKSDCVSFPYLRVANVQDGHLDLSVIKKINLPKDKVKRYQLQKGDVLLTEGGDFDKLGRGTVWNNEIENCVHQNHIFVARPKQDVLLSEFLTMQTGGPHGKKYFLSCSKQSTNLASINSSQLKAFPVLLPPLLEQKAIAEILETWDRAIEKTERLIDAKQKRFNALMWKLIVDNGKLKIKNGELKTAKTGWRVVKLGDVFTERNETKRPDLPLLSITGREGVIPRENTNRKDSSNQDKSKYLRICSGDIGYNTMRMWQGVSALSQLEGIVSPAYTICAPSASVHAEYMAYLFKTPHMIYEFYRHSQGLTSDTWNLKFRHFKEISALLPPIDIQIKITETLNAAQKEIDLLKKLVEKYKTQKRGLMQKLLTGEWRVHCGTSDEFTPSASDEL